MMYDIYFYARILQQQYDPVALAAVIISGVVAVSSLAVGPFIAWRKGIREKEEKKRDEITNKVEKLFKELTIFTTSSSGQYFDLLTAFYAWEVAIRPYCRKGCRDDLAELRGKIIDLKRGNQGWEELAIKIIEITDTALGHETKQPRFWQRRKKKQEGETE